MASSSFRNWTTARGRGLQGVSFNLPHESETDAVTPVTFFEAIARGRADARRSGEPGAAPHVMLRAIARQPGGAVAGRATIVRMPAILHPFEDIPERVV